MYFEKNKAKKIPFTLVDAAGAYLTAKTPTVTVSKDGAALAAATGTVSELAGGGYVLSASAADLNADSVLFRIVASGAKDTFISGETNPLLSKLTSALGVKDTYSYGVYLTNIEGKPIKNATVNIKVGSSTVATKISGSDSYAKFELNGGTYSVEVVASGYTTVTKNITLSKDLEDSLVLAVA